MGLGRHRWMLQGVAALFGCALVACGDNDAAPRPAGPSAAALAAAGEAAFFATLWGDADREREALELLGAAVRKNPADGRSYFLLGMTHLQRFARLVGPDPRTAPAPLREEIARARAALDRAVELLPDDRRVPGFRGAATFTEGVVTGDGRRIEEGLAQLRASVALFPEFNSFSFIGAVAPVVGPSDPLFAEVMEYVGDPLTAACSPFTQPEICGNAGKAPRNVEGSLVLFGDLFAKAGDARRATGFYTLAKAFPGAEGWRFRALVDERLRTVRERVALYQDGDPANDPPLIGVGAEACASCHYR